MERIKLAQIIEGKTSLLSRGFCPLKIVENGEEKILELPIRSIGIVELQERLNAEMPKPPSRMEKIEKGSEIGKRFDLAEDTPMRVFDMTDSDYIKAMQDYQNDMMWKTVIQAIDIEFQDSNGTTITDYHRKKEILQGTGISGHHLDTIMRAVADLTKEREDKADFLSGKPSESQERCSPGAMEKR